MKSILNWLAAAASLIGLFFTLYPATEVLTPWKVTVLVVIVLVFLFFAVTDIKAERKNSAKSYDTDQDINNYMFDMLKNSGKCEICSRDASWISDKRINRLLIEKAKNNELTFLVHEITKALKTLEQQGATVIEYGALGFDPIARFTVVNSGNHASSYVAIGRRKPNGPHVIEEMDSSHPTYSMAVDLIRIVKIANAKIK